MSNKNILKAARSLGLQQNVLFRVIDQKTGKVVQEHQGHNCATNAMLWGIAQHLIGDFFSSEHTGVRPAYPILSNYVPRYISLGTMGLIDQTSDSHGLPAGVGDTRLTSESDPTYGALKAAYESSKNRLELAKLAMASECPYWMPDAGYHNSGEGFTADCANCDRCRNRVTTKKAELEAAQLAYDEAYYALIHYDEESRFAQYMSHCPGYGADGYDPNENNGRRYFGLGYPYTSYNVNSNYNVDDKVMYQGDMYICNTQIPTPAGPFNLTKWDLAQDSDQPCWIVTGDEANPHYKTTINVELISPSFPRQLISFRDVVPEYEAELPKTIDVVFSAMISTGALKQFRPDGQGYIFITEAGLWSKQYWNNSGENGLLAGYRIAPPNQKNWAMTTEQAEEYLTLHPEDTPSNVPAGETPAQYYAEQNRELLKRTILRVGVNQVVQVVWKIQLGSLDELKSDQLQPEFYDGEVEIIDGGN